MLSAEALANARSTLQTLLDPLKSEGARITLSPVLQGPTSKGEFQIFYEGSSSTSAPSNTFNAPFKRLRTLRFRAFVVLKDLRDPWAALPLLEQSKSLLTGIMLFGLHEEAEYEGGLEPTADQFSQLDAEGGWVYQVNFQCQILEQLPLPYVLN